MSFCQENFTTDKEREAYKKGFIQGSADKFYCPHKLEDLKPNLRAAWLNGYDDAQQKGEKV